MKGKVWEMVATAAQMTQKCSRVMADLTNHHEETLYQRISQIIEAARTHVSRTVNTAMVHDYWLVGQEIVEGEQQGKERAEYGDLLVKHLAARLTERFGKGFTASNIKRTRQFYLAFPERHFSTGAAKGAALRRLSPFVAEPLFAPRPGVPRGTLVQAPPVQSGRLVSQRQAVVVATLGG